MSSDTKQHPISSQGVEETSNEFRPPQNLDPQRLDGMEMSVLRSGDQDTIAWPVDDNPDHPYNWPKLRIYTNAGILTFLAFLNPLSSSIIAPGVPQIMEEFDRDSPELAAFIVSIFVLGSAFGPLVFAPMSEIYGRLIVYHIANVGFVAFMVACALAPSLESLIGFRFLAGFFGSCPITNGGASIADLVPPERRGAFMAGFAVGPLLGPVVGPIIAGFLTSAMGWRWNFWLMVIVAGVVTVGLFIFGTETYAPILLQRKVDRLKEATGNENLRHELDDGLTPWGKIKRGIVRPAKLLFLTPIGLVFALHLAVVYGYIYLMFSSVTQVFSQQYGIRGSLSGLVFLGMGIGSLIGVLATSIVTDRAIKTTTAGGKTLVPEVRLQLTPIGGLFLPAGLFMYGWSAEYHVHWIVPILGMTLMGVGNVIMFMSICLYLIDCFGIYSASALAANTVVRSIGGGLLPLAGLRLFASLGVGWGNSLLGFIATAMIPIPLLFLKYGALLRGKFDMKSL
ncbi:major facilitator superfamily domain-containing protein [Stachybotrys elegans]|uniref:Major facilitator superfamily domain-containing protein n=1 Tax=Stachybotrys elegans TaxID=80388 RepID=A0A8K0SPE8_9HYPO|nr:major facilitator superfamily domain-containing protein [Stachybotrys elegans]